MLFIESAPMPLILSLSQMKCGLQVHVPFTIILPNKSQNNVDRIQDGCRSTVKILCIGTDRSRQTVQTKIRLLLNKQSEQVLRCLPLHQLLLDALMQCYIKLYQF